MSTKPSEFLDQEVLPRLFEQLDAAFPEMGWKRQGNGWIATNEEWSRSQHGARPDRVCAYPNSKHCYVVHGDAKGTIPWASYVLGGGEPRGKNFFTAVERLAEKAGVKYPYDDNLGDPKNRLSLEWSKRLATALKANAGAMEWLTKKRGWSPTVIERFHLGLTVKAQGKPGETYTNALTFPHVGRSGIAIGHYYLTDIPGVTSFEKLEDHRRGSTWGKRLPEKPLFYSGSISGKSKVLLVEGFKDLFAVATLLEGDPLEDELLIVTATHGAGSVLTTPELRDPAFWDRFDTVYLGLDADEAGQRAVQALLPFISKGALVPSISTKFATKPDKRADWNDLLLTGTREDFKTVLKEAKSPSVELKAPTNPISYEEIDINVAYHNGYLYWPFEMPESAIENGQVLEEFRTLVLRSDGRILDVKESPRISNRGRAIKRLTDETPIIAVPRPVRSSQTSWHWSSIKSFAEAAKSGQLDLLPQPALGDLVEKIYKHIRACIWLPYREDYATVTLGIVTSYAQEIFAAVPLFLLIGERGSGKTELGKIAAAFGCNGVALGRTTVAGLMEACNRYRGLVAVDDFEELGAKSRGNADAAINDMAQVIKQSYKKTGGTHTRVGDGELTQRNLFGVKFLNNTLGADAITLSRMFSIRTRRMTEQTKAEIQKFAGDILTPVQINELRNQLHVWVYSHVEQIAAAAEVFLKDKVNRDDEIALPLRVLARLANLPYLVSDVESAISRRLATNTETDEETALREALRALIQEGHEFLNVYQVMNEMASMLGSTHGAESKADIPEWQRPHVLGKRLLGFWFDETKMIRKRLEHEQIANFRPRFYQVLPDRRQELLDELKKAGAPVMVQTPKRPGDFCSGCETCRYRERCFIRQDYARTAAPKTN